MKKTWMPKGVLTKNPDAALHKVPRHSGVRKSTPHSSEFVRLACGLFESTQPYAVRRTIVSFFFCVLMMASPVWAAIDIKEVQKNYAPHKDFTVNFTQQTYQVIVNKHVDFTGKVYYKKPGKARMDVSTPQRQILILSGTTVSISLPDEGTQSVQEVPKEFATQNILAFIAGFGSIDNDYTVKNEDDHLSLTPKQGTGTINIWISPENTVRRIQVQDAMGNKSDIQLSGYKFDSGLSDSLFVPPVIQP